MTDGSAEMMQYAKKIAREAREASFHVANLDPKTKNKILRQIAARLRRESRNLISANRKDVEYGVQTGLTKALLDRITLNEKRVGDMADSMEAVARLPDPVGEHISRWRRPNGLVISKVRVPLGVILIIYEARPN
ncbi:MAG: gamma-glutamyl-phosphate reductase, partial [Candidatus Omnitrophica bacterium]|nr:gamma-glutamyl-phosphate reductase [Candidatus Omnitrophota bacterium]